MAGIFEFWLRKFTCIIITTLIVVSSTGIAQTIQDQQNELLRLEKQPGFKMDTVYLNKAIQLGFLLAESNPDSAFAFLDNQLENCQNARFKKGEALVLKIMGNAFQNKGEFKKSIGYYNRALSIAEAIPDDLIIPGILNNIGLVYFNLGIYVEALNYYFKALKGAEIINNTFVQSAVLNNIAAIYFEQGKLDEAGTNYKSALEIDSLSGNTRRMVLAYNNLGDVRLKQKRPLEALNNLKKGFAIAKSLNSPDLIEMTARTLASIYVALDSVEKADGFYRQSIAIAKEKGFALPYTQSLIGLADLLLKRGNFKEAFGYAQIAKALADTMGQIAQLRNVHELLLKIYEAKGDFPEAFKSSMLFKQFSDSINNLQSQRIASNYEAEYELTKRTLEFEKSSLRQQWLIISAFAALISIGIILFIIVRNRNQLTAAYKKLHEKSVELGNKNEMLEKALNQLRTTQMQLVHAEKMASLGEITAGIAHEIQNPLNFINNFSELNAELIQEAETEAIHGNLSEFLELVKDVKDNEAKIIQHGKRADAIVKGMIAHSRTGSGKRVSTDLEMLSKEYVRLAFQGFKTKDLNFDASYRFEADPNLPRMDLVPQDIGRVIFNLAHNAFYAVNERKKIAGHEFKPFVEVCIKDEGKLIAIYIRDNGGGIPDAILNKIFQPFFTTKPTGEGTGLGLSMSYDIVKAHGGELKVKTLCVEGATQEFYGDQRTEFIIQIPINQF